MGSAKKRIILINEREKRKLSQTEVAKYIGINVMTYSNIERGVRNPGLKTAIKIADFFKIDIKKL